MGTESDHSNRSSQSQDAAMMKRIVNGDERICRIIVEQQIKRLHRFAYRMLGDSGDAEEVVQEGFLRLWKQAPSWKSNALISTWLHQVAHNLCIDRMRRRREELPGILPEQPDPGASALDQHYQQQVTQFVNQALNTLPERQKTAINLVHYQFVGNKEAANIMNITVEALESLLTRGRRGLKKQLQEHKPDLMES